VETIHKTALVTGGAGFIGSHLVELLVSKGWEIRVLDDLSTGHLENLEAVKDRIGFTIGSVTDPMAVANGVTGCEVVFHLAAKVFVPESFEIPDEYERVNVGGTAVVLDAARKAGVRRVVFSSTCAVYGNPTKLPISEDDPVNPLSPYAKTKLAGEELGKKYAESGGPAFTALRYFNVYGSRQDPRSAYSGVISRFADAIKKGTAPTIYGDGSQTRDFIHVSDVAQANLQAGSQSRTGFSVYNVGTGLETSIAELFKFMAEAKGFRMPPQHSPVRAGDIVRSVAGNTRAKSALGFTVRALVRDRLGEL